MFTLAGVPPGDAASVPSVGRLWPIGEPPEKHDKTVIMMIS